MLADVVVLVHNVSTRQKQPSSICLEPVGRMLWKLVAKENAS